MAGPEWDDELSDALQRITAAALHTDGLDEDDIQAAHRSHGQRFNDIDERLWREWTSEAFFQYSADTNNERSPYERFMDREAWFDYMLSLGFDLDNTEFWDAWREHMGYSG